MIITNIPVPHISLFRQTHLFLSGKSYFLSVQLRTVSEEESYGFIDLSPSFEKETDYIIPEDGHWNLKGHRITALSLLKPIRKIMDAR